MKVLVICDDIWHPGEVIARGLAPLADKGIDLDVVMDAKDILVKDMLTEYDVMIVAKGDALTGANSQANWFEDEVTAVMPCDIREYIENGGGLIALHAGNCFRTEKRPDFTAITGNSFIGHPRQCHIDTRFTGDHPILEGVKEFGFRDEHYQITVEADDIVPLFDTVSESAGTQPGGYVRTLGKGRVCVLTPGHNCAVLRHPEYQKMLFNAILWCAGK
ncbi:MAG: ThuA domain-containing protein [Oscillospiraceae bacterium]|nr:ThuA domain-containing protein [Oscillospiraceae bacterium]